MHAVARPVSDHLATGPDRTRRRASGRWWLLTAALAGFVAWLVTRARDRSFERAGSAGDGAPTATHGLVSPYEATLGAREEPATADAGAPDVISLVDPPAPGPEQLQAGSDMLGTRLGLDDLEAVEGIGPAIGRLLRDRGITTWRALSTTDVAALREILDAGGSRFRVHDPASWPEQARLLADGEWAAFRALTDRLDAGRATAPPSTPGS